MSARLQVTADLDFAVELPDGRAVEGRLQGHGHRLQLQVDDPAAFAGRSDARALVAIADLLRSRGLVVDVVGAGTAVGRRARPAVLVSLGAVHAPWWQRRLTGSRHVRLGDWRGLLAPGRALLRSLGSPGGLLPDRGLLPPGTPQPIAPTFARRVRRPATTTHDPARGGQPHLVLVDRDRYLPGDRQPIFWLGEGSCRIGSGPDCDIRLTGLHDLHAEVIHDDRDEYVVVAHAPDTRVHGAPVTRSILRTGARLELGRWLLTYTRAEYADHGRPFGGRVGGEVGHQRPQPPRSSVQEVRHG